MNREEVVKKDSLDPLQSFIDRFVITDTDTIYLDGNSLGRLPKQTQQEIPRMVNQEWGETLIEGWQHNWFCAPQRVGSKIAKIVGAQAGEVIVADSTSINLFKLVVSALNYQVNRSNIVTDEFNFPSDHYILKSALKASDKEDGQLTIVSSQDGISISYEDIADSLDQNTAVLCLSQVAFKSGYLYDMVKINKLAKSKGVLVVWDLSHSVGAVPIDLNRSGAELAVGCTYKYLNGGPGAPAFLYVRKELVEKLSNPITGWFGHSNLFAFDLDYTPAIGIERFQVGTPPVLSLQAIEYGVDILIDAGMEQIRSKSVQLSEYLIELYDEKLKGLGFSLNSPRDFESRGSHVSFGHSQGYQIAKSLIHDKKVIPDFREPDNIRIGIAPLYTSFCHIFDFVERLEEITFHKLHEKHSSERSIVT